MPEDKLELVDAEEPKTLDPETRAAYNEETKDLQDDQLREAIKDLQQDRVQRKQYADRLFRLVVVWLIVVGVMVFLHGFSDFPFKLPVAVLNTLIGSTTASILGLFAIVANYLFPKR